jgi:hypothetical protein
MSGVLDKFIKGVNENSECMSCNPKFCSAHVPIERIDSVINALLSDVNNRLKLQSNESLNHCVKAHFKHFSCTEFFLQTSKEKLFLEQVHKSDKYSGESGKAFAE